MIVAVKSPVVLESSQRTRQWLVCMCYLHGYHAAMNQYSWVNHCEFTDNRTVVFLTWKWCSSNFCVNLFLKKCLKKTWMKTDFLRHCLIWMLALSKSMHVVFVIRMFYFNLIMLNIFDHIWRLIHMYFQENFVSESTCLFVSQCLLKKIVSTCIIYCYFVWGTWFWNLKCVPTFWQRIQIIFIWIYWV